MRTTNINEGLLPLPSNLTNQVTTWIYQDCLWYFRDLFTPEIRKKYPQQWKNFVEMVDELQIELPYNKYNLAGNGININKFKLSQSDFPSSYAKLQPINDTVYVALDWLGKAVKSPDRGGGDGQVSGGWVESKRVILLYVSGCKDLTQPKFQDEYMIESMAHCVSSVVEVAQHELRHAIQDLVLKQINHKRFEKGENYHKDYDSYYTSQTEFEPQIGSAVYEFVQYIQLMQEYKKKIDLGKMIRVFVGIDKGRIGDIGTFPFFKALKKSDINRWETAVRKFFVEIKNNLKQRTTNDIP